MKTIETDVAIIGSGTAGLNALSEVDNAGGRWRLIESGKYGTMCARSGCMPSKLLIAAAEVAHTVDHHSSIFGIDVKNRTINASSIFGRVRDERDRFVSFIKKDMASMPQENLISGHAKFIGPTILQVDKHTTIHARSIIIATGSTSFIPPVFEQIKDEVLLNEDIFELESLPISLAVIGTGVIGLELGQSLHRLGVDTVFYGRSENLATLSDPAVLKNAQETLGAELNFQFNSSITHAEKTTDGIKLKWEDKQGHKYEQIFEKVLVATGRKSTLSNLNIEAIGYNEEQINSMWNPESTQVGKLPIFITGDASISPKILHEASDEGRIAGLNAMKFPNTVLQKRRTPLAITFTDPQIAFAGKRHDQLNADMFEFGEETFDDQGRARVMNQYRGGMIRIYVNRQNCKLIGAEIFSPKAEHLAHLLSWAIQQELTAQQVLDMPIYHPVLEEGIESALRDVIEKLKSTSSCQVDKLSASQRIYRAVK